MATTVERLGVVETKVANLDEKLDDLKGDVKDVHDCLDKTRDEVTKQLTTMHSEACRQHTSLESKIDELEKSKNKMMMYGMVGMAFIAGLGWTGQLNLPTIFKFFGI